MTRSAPAQCRHRLRRVAACLFVLIALPVQPATASGGPGPLVFVQEAAVDTGLASRLVALAADGQFSVLTEGFAAAADPAVSYDGQRLLFAARLRPESRWEIWEMAADGSGKTRVASAAGDCREPAYLATAAVDAPNFRDRVRWITYTATLPSAVDEQGRGALTALWATHLTPLAGRDPVLWRTTYNLGGDRAPTVLADGRVLYSSWQRQGYALMTISWAGEDLNPFYGSEDSTVSQLAACELRASRRVVFVERQGEAGDGSGQLAEVSLRRPLHSHRILSRDQGRYRTPQEAADGGLLVAWAPPGGKGSFGIYRFDERSGRPGAVVYDDPRWHDVDPNPLAARAEPTARIPMAEMASVLDLGGFKNAGQIQCMNVYDTDRPDVAAIRRGQVQAVRFVEGLTLSPAEAQARRQQGAAAPGAWPPPFVATRSLGEAPVEADGSFYVNAVGDTPFYVQTLDAQGQVLTTMRTWMWVRNGDQRGCIGCHENKELAPENRATQALVKGQPTWMLGPRSLAAPVPR
jgi:hypothetical protein